MPNNFFSGLKDRNKLLFWFGWLNILLLALVYAIISITGIMTLVMLAFKGAKLMNTHVVEHNEKRITGMILILVGIVTFFVH